MSLKHERNRQGSSASHCHLQMTMLVELTSVFSLLLVYISFQHTVSCLSHPQHLYKHFQWGHALLADEISLSFPTWPCGSIYCHHHFSVKALCPWVLSALFLPFLPTILAMLLLSCGCLLLVSRVQTSRAPLLPLAALALFSSRVSSIIPVTWLQFVANQTQIRFSP